MTLYLVTRITRWRITNAGNSSRAISRAAVRGGNFSHFECNRSTSDTFARERKPNAYRANCSARPAAKIAIFRRGRDFRVESLPRAYRRLARRIIKTSSRRFRGDLVFRPVDAIGLKSRLRQFARNLARGSAVSLLPLEHLRKQRRVRGRG